MIQTLDLFRGLNLGMGAWKGLTVERVVALRKTGWITIWILLAGSEINRGARGGRKTPLKVQKMPMKLKMKGRNMPPDSNRHPLFIFYPFHIILIELSNFHIWMRRPGRLWWFVASYNNMILSSASRARIMDLFLIRKQQSAHWAHSKCLIFTADVLAYLGF